MLVTELMERGDLYTLLGKYQGRFAWAKLGRYVALDVARGLAFLHSRNIVHFEYVCDWSCHRAPACSDVFFKCQTLILAIWCTTSILQCTACMIMRLEMTAYAL